MTYPKWKQDAIDSINESIQFFSNKNKFNREKHIVRALLAALGVSYMDRELVKAPEPTDVKFRDADFQVKEVMQPGRLRSDEYRKALERAKKAKKPKDLLQGYSPVDLTLREIVERSVSRSEELTSKYGPNERLNLDLVCYVNFLDTHEVTSAFSLPEAYEFRSLSVVSNTFRVVLYAQDSAPEYLKSAIGNVYRR